jgi:cytochrome c
MFRQSALLFAVLGLATCGSSKSSPAEPEPAAAEPAPTPAAADPEPAVDSFAAQVERGAELYGANCAGCHGADGSGTDKAPPVVGEAALPLDPPAGAKHRDVKFETALDVFKWVVANMPAGDPGSLTDAQYVDILAFDLKANGVELEQPLDAEVAAGLKLH